MSGYDDGQPVIPSWCRACPGRHDQIFLCTLNSAVCQFLRALWRDFWSLRCLTHWHTTFY